MVNQKVKMADIRKLSDFKIDSLSPGKVRQMEVDDMVNSLNSYYNNKYVDGMEEVCTVDGETHYFQTRPAMHRVAIRDHDGNYHVEEVRVPPLNECNIYCYCKSPMMPEVGNMREDGENLRYQGWMQCVRCHAHGPERSISINKNAIVPLDDVKKKLKIDVQYEHQMHYAATAMANGEVSPEVTKELVVSFRLLSLFTRYTNYKNAHFDYGNYKSCVSMVNRDLERGQNGGNNLAKALHGSNAQIIRQIQNTIYVGFDLNSEINNILAGRY